MRCWSLSSLCLLLVTQLVGCHLIFPFSVDAPADASAVDGTALPDGIDGDVNVPPDGQQGSQVVIQGGQQVQSFSLALDAKGRAHLIYLLQGDLRHAVVEKGQIGSDDTLDLGIVDAAGSAINDQDVMLVVYGKQPNLELWRTSRDLTSPTSPWSKPLLNTKWPGAYDTIELTSSGPSFYGGCTGLNAGGQPRLVLMHIGTQVIGCGLNLTNPPAPVRVAAGAGHGVISLLDDKQRLLLISKLASDPTFCSEVKSVYTLASNSDPLPLVLDSKGTIHAVETQSDRLQHLTWDTTGNKYDIQELFPLPASSQASIDLAIDSQDRIHMFYQIGGERFWRFSTSPGAWTEATPVATASGVISRALVRIRENQIGFAFAAPGGGVGYVQRQLP